ncbi:hypothetical protein [Nocardia sp. NPDC050710]|uniref:hypothetical protein n=1 Tax=Nocardia sp. NPDC050710 TaxID=3157220 RepID=UPI00340585C2
MIGASVCLALALLVTPEPSAVRRRAALFGGPTLERKAVHGSIFRLGFGIIPMAGLILGAGPLLAVGLVAGTMAVRVRRARRERRRTVAGAQLLDALEAVIGELRVGAHPSAAAAVAARESSGVAAQVFAVGAARSRLGGSGADGLRRPDAVVAVELDRIADAWQVAEHHGLALAELLAAARADLVGRIRFRARTGAALAGARATAAVLAGLPLLGIGLGQLMGAAPLQVLFASSAGTVLLPLGTGLVCAGLLWTDAITEKVLV